MQQPSSQYSQSSQQQYQPQPQYQQQPQQQYQPQYQQQYQQSPQYQQEYQPQQEYQQEYQPQQYQQPQYQLQPQYEQPLQPQYQQQLQNQVQQQLINSEFFQNNHQLQTLRDEILENVINILIKKLEITFRIYAEQNNIPLEKIISLWNPLSDVKIPIPHNDPHSATMMNNKIVDVVVNISQNRCQNTNTKGTVCHNEISEKSRYYCSKHLNPLSQNLPDIKQSNNQQYVATLPTTEIKTTTLVVDYHLYRMEDGRYFHKETGFIFDKQKGVVQRMVSSCLDYKKNVETRDITEEDTYDCKRYGFQYTLPAVIQPAIVFTAVEKIVKDEPCSNGSLISQSLLESKSFALQQPLQQQQPLLQQQQPLQQQQQTESSPSQ